MCKPLLFQENFLILIKSTTEILYGEHYHNVSKNLNQLYKIQKGKGVSFETKLISTSYIFVTKNLISCEQY